MPPNATGDRMETHESEPSSVPENGDEFEMTNDEISKSCRSCNSTTKQSAVTDTAVKMSLLQLLFSMKYWIKRFYIVFWHELSMDPAVKAHPWAETPENEVVLSAGEKFNIRRRRIFFLVIHLIALVGLYYCLVGRVHLYTILWATLVGCMSSIGVTAGAHRLWSHHSFKANWQLRTILMLFQTMAVQYSLYNWARDHRLHHKCTDTEADPHNSNRGFFFSHIGWALTLPHPEVEKRLKNIDMKDFEQDKVAMFQYHYYVPLSLLLCYVVPTLVPWYFWGEDLMIAHVVACHLRHVITLHGTFLINSAAHMFGTKPYDKSINPTENMFVSFASFGDGWHNYHHVFPWDYRNSELWDYKLNISTLFVDIFALIGWAYELRTVPQDVVYKRVKRTGDGTHAVWGWDDKEIPAEDKEMADVRYKKE